MKEKNPGNLVLVCNGISEASQDFFKEKSTSLFKYSFLQGLHCVVPSWCYNNKQASLPEGIADTAKAGSILNLQ